MSDKFLTPDSTGEARKQLYAEERAQIDDSARVPVLLFFASSLFWLLIGTMFALIAAFKMHDWWFLDGVPALTFGRVRPAHLNAVAYGWVSLSSFGLLLWLMARLSRTPILYPSLLVIACALWNLGVFLGIVAILAGEGSSIEWLEFPAYVPPILVAGYAFVATWALATFRLRREKHLYVSQWYIFGALFWLPWLYSVGNLLLLYAPVKGVTQATVNWWFGHNWLGLWVTPIGLASAYYLIPKVFGRPVYSYYLSIIGFWALALFYNWAGMHHLIGGPIPAWLTTASAVGSMMMLIPVSMVALNHHMTAFPKWEWKAMKRSHRILWASPTLRFVVFGAVSYTWVSIQGAFQALPFYNRTTHFTHYTIAHAHFGLYAFYTMIAFGSMYYIVPRLTGWEWASPNLIRMHFWCTVLGFILYFVSLTWGGWFQGKMMNDPKVPFIEVTKYTVPYLRWRTVAGAIMAVGHISFVILFVLNVMRKGQRREGPTLLDMRRPEPEPEVAGAAS